MAIFQSYDQKGKKLSFANWISNISPEDTPFASATGKETIDQTSFSWQTDTLAKATIGVGVVEGSDAGDSTLTPTVEISNQTQIFRKVVAVSDTANSTANYGRGRELMYQLEKAGAELKRDIEITLLQNGNQKAPAGAGPTATGRTTGGFSALVGRTGTGAAATVNTLGGTHTGTTPDEDFGQKVVIDSAAGAGITEGDLFDLTRALYIVGSKADTIMVHPKHAGAFSQLQEAYISNTNGAAATRVRYFENSKTIDLEVNTIVDPLGQTFKILYNRFMPEDKVYIFTPSDWTQMILRAPMRTELAKTGSSSKWMIECELGLRHRNPYASGIINLK